MTVHTTVKTPAPPAPAPPPAAEALPPTLNLRLVERLLPVTTGLVVALVALVVLGGATRVMEAGLACPDWPLCYSSFWPGQQMNVRVFLEWFHRLDAFLVGIGLLLQAGLTMVQRHRLPVVVPRLAVAAALLVALQGALGALTVTRLLRFDIVTAHLATGLLLVALVSLLRQQLQLLVQPLTTSPPPVGRRLAVAVAGAVYLQCILGGLLASQWATARCLRFMQGCHWLLAHRTMAVAAAAAVLLLVAVLLWQPCPQRLQRLAAAAGVLVALQLLLGQLTLQLALSRPLVTIAHQLIAALLVGLLVSLARLMCVQPPASSTLTAAVPQSP